MAKELSFTDPAFTCRVVLTGPAKALYDTAGPQFERLKGIRSLGLISHINDIAIHTRHQHLIGLMRIFNKLCQQPQGSGLPKRFLWSFWCRICFGQTGHAALSYDSEKAVLLACHLDSSFKERFRAFLQPITSSLEACQLCDKQCDSKSKGPTEGAAWFEELVQRNLWERVHLWVATLKLIQDPRILVILNQQEAGNGNALGFSKAEALKMSIASQCDWNQAFYRLDRLDYIVRDLAFAGTLGIQVDVDGLIACADEEHPDWSLLKYLENYLKNTLYESIEVQTTSVLFQRALAASLLSGKVSLEDLFGLDPASAIDDAGLAKLLQKKEAGREVFYHDRRNAWRTWPIKCFVDPEHMPCEVETSITGRAKQHLSDHIRTRVTCLRLTQEHSIGLAVCHQDQARRPAAKSFVRLCRSALAKKYPQLDPGNLTTVLFEGLVGLTCEHALGEATERLANLTIPQAVLQGAARVVNRREGIRAASSTEIRIRIGSFDYSLQGDPRLNIMHAALMGDDEVRSNLRLSLAEAARILWHQLLSWQSIYFRRLTPKKIPQLVEEAQKIFAQSVKESSPTAQDDLQLYTLLEALKHPSQSVSFRLALPRLILLREDKTPENEYDAVSVVLKEDKDVEIWIWGATTEAKVSSKKNKDRAKIQKLKDRLGNRWGDEIRIVENYIHKVNNKIFCEIDGRQYRR